MILRFFLGSFLLLHLSCNIKDKRSSQNSDPISKSIEESIQSAIPFEGKFIRIDKINEREYYLYLKDSNDSTFIFLTIMPFADSEIQLLKKDTTNIKLRYYDFYNGVRKKTEKVVKFMQPMYEFR
jgi:hypothetical protein